VNMATIAWASIMTIAIPLTVVDVLVESKTWKREEWRAPNASCHQFLGSKDVLCFVVTYAILKFSSSYVLCASYHIPCASVLFWTCFTLLYKMFPSTYFMGLFFTRQSQCFHNNSFLLPQLSNCFSNGSMPQQQYYMWHASTTNKTCMLPFLHFTTITMFDTTLFMLQ
jgi:hypothetical protein